MFQAINKYCRVQYGYGSHPNVNQVHARPDDRMESFWIAETLKYLYMLQVSGMLCCFSQFSSSMHCNSLPTTPFPWRNTCSTQRHTPSQFLALSVSWSSRLCRAFHFNALQCISSVENSFAFLFPYTPMMFTDSSTLKPGCASTSTLYVPACFNPLTSWPSLSYKETSASVAGIFTNSNK